MFSQITRSTERTTKMPAHCALCKCVWHAACPNVNASLLADSPSPRFRWFQGAVNVSHNRPVLKKAEVSAAEHGRKACRITRKREGSIARLFVFDQAVIDGKHGQFKPMGHTHLVEDAAEVVLDRILADAQFLGDLPVRQTGNDCAEDVPLATRE